MIVGILTIVSLLVFIWAYLTDHEESLAWMLYAIVVLVATWVTHLRM